MARLCVGSCVKDGNDMRKIRSDCKIGTLEKKLGLENVFRNLNGRNTRSDKLVGTVRKELKKLTRR